MCSVVCSAHHCCMNIRSTRVREEEVQMQGMRRHHYLRSVLCAIEHTIMHVCTSCSPNIMCDCSSCSSPLLMCSHHVCSSHVCTSQISCHIELFSDACQVKSKHHLHSVVCVITHVQMMMMEFIGTLCSNPHSHLSHRWILLCKAQPILLINEGELPQ